MIRSALNPTCFPQRPPMPQISLPTIRLSLLVTPPSDAAGDQFYVDARVKLLDAALARFKRPWDDGTDGLLMAPFQLIARLAAIVPQPRKNLIHYHGIFAPAAAGRAAIVPVRPPPAARPTLLPPHALLPPRAKSPSWIPWATLLHRVFIRLTDCHLRSGSAHRCPCHSPVPSARRTRDRLCRPPAQLRRTSSVLS